MPGSVFQNIFYQISAPDSRFATDVYLVDREQKEEAVEKMRRYFVTRNLNVHTRYQST